MARPHADAAGSRTERDRAAPAVARAGRHRRPVPGDPAAEAGLAQRHARPPLDAPRSLRRTGRCPQGLRGRVGGARPRPRQRRRARRLPHRPRQVGRDRPARCRRMGRVAAVGHGRRRPGPVAQPRRHRHRAGGPRRRRRHRCARARRRPDRLAAPDPQRPVGRNAGRPARGAPAREQRRDRHRHRRPLVGPGLRRRRHDGRIRHRRRAHLDRGAPHPRRVPHPDRPPAHHRRRPGRAAPRAVRGIRRRGRGDHRSARRTGPPRGRAADPVVLRVGRRRARDAACRTRSRPAPTTRTKPPSP